MRVHNEENQRDLQHYRTCDVCGQTFDTTDPEQIFHHDGEPHEPMTPNAEDREEDDAH